MLVGMVAPASAASKSSEPEVYAVIDGALGNTETSYDDPDGVAEAMAIVLVSVERIGVG